MKRAIQAGMRIISRWRLAKEPILVEIEVFAGVQIHRFPCRLKIRSSHLIDKKFLLVYCL
jgi:hypothetical protein